MNYVGVSSVFVVAPIMHGDFMLGLNLVIYNSVAYHLADKMGCSCFTFVAFFACICFFESKCFFLMVPQMGL